MLLIRAFEIKVLDLFSKGKVRGTTHTSIGQEANAVGVISALNEGDFIFSNHRNHGHYISSTGDIKGLMGEIMGLDSGASHGIGGSQHIHNNYFISNGVQGGIVSNSVGVALSYKIKNNNKIVVCFMGDGTFGEGIVYESFNLASLLEVPIIFVVENNKYAQSTPIESNLAGSLSKRFSSMDIENIELNTTNVFEIMDKGSLIIDKVRSEKRPFGFILNCDRLAPHSKGDDYRSNEQMERIKKNDPLIVSAKILGFNNFDSMLEEKMNLVDKLINNFSSDVSL